MAFKPLSKTDQKRIMDTVDAVDELVQDGESPTGAIVKAAKEHKLTTTLAKLVVHAYNTGATTEQRLSHDDPLDKAANFELADAHEVETALLDRPKPMSKVASQHIGDYLIKPKWASEPKFRQLAKAASDDSGESSTPSDYVAIRDRSTALNDDFREARAQLTGVERKLHEKLAAFDRLMRRPGAPSLADFRDAVKPLHGNIATVLLDDIARGRPELEKRGSAGWLQYDAAKEPFRTFNQAVEFANSGMEKAAQVDSAREVMLDFADRVALPYMGRPNAMAELAGGRREFSKVANLSGIDLLREVGNSIHSLIGEKSPKPYGEYGQMSTLLAPSHAGEMRDIRSQAMLASLMADDDVLSEYEPDQVAKAHGELMSMAPEAMRQPATARTALRKYLQQNGSMDLFEQSQLNNVNDQFAKRSEPIDRMLMPRQAYGGGGK